MESFLRWVRINLEYLIPNDDSSPLHHHIAANEPVPYRISFKTAGEPRAQSRPTNPLASGFRWSSGHNKSLQISQLMISDCFGFAFERRYTYLNYECC